MEGGKTSETVVRDENTKFWRSLRLDQNTVNANRFGNVEALWFRIEAEPTPFHDLAGFEEVLDTHLDIKREQWRATAGQVLDKHAASEVFFRSSSSSNVAAAVRAITVRITNGWS